MPREAGSGSGALSLYDYSALKTCGFYLREDVDLTLERYSAHACGHYRFLVILRILSIKNLRFLNAGIGGSLKSLYELCFLNSYIVNIVKYSATPRYLEESFLKREYVEKGLSLRKIAQKRKCSRSSVRSRLIKSGLKDFSKKNLKTACCDKLHKEILAMRKKWGELSKGCNLPE